MNSNQIEYQSDHHASRSVYCQPIASILLDEESSSRQYLGSRASWFRWKLILAKGAKMQMALTMYRRACLMELSPPPHEKGWITLVVICAAFSKHTISKECGYHEQYIFVPCCLNHLKSHGDSMSGDPQIGGSLLLMKVQASWAPCSVIRWACANLGSVLTEEYWLNCTFFIPARRAMCQITVWTPEERWFILCQDSELRCKTPTWDVMICIEARHLHSCLRIERWIAYGNT